MAGSGPRLHTLIWMRMSSGVLLAYSTKTSKYRSPLKIPVSSSSYSMSPGCAAIRLDQVVVGIGRLRILVEPLHVRMGRRAIEVVVIFLDVLAVVALAVGEAEQAFLQDRVLAVPQGEGKAQNCLSSEKPARPSSPQ